MARAIRDLLRGIQRQGFRVKLTRRNHYKIYDPTGRLVACAPGTPSSQRSISNLVAVLRRAGLRWPAG